MQLTKKSAPIRRQLAAAALTLLGISLAHAEPTSADRHGGLAPLQIDPSLLGPGAAPRQAPTEDAGVSMPPARSRFNVEDLAAADAPWRVDTGFLYYKEGDGRIQTKEAVINVKRGFSDDSKLSLKLTVDTLTGGSPNGALPSKSVQTFSTPSGTTLQATPATSTPTTPQTYTTASGSVVQVGGNGSASHSTVYSVAPGALPIDKTFQDERIALSLGREQVLGSSNRLSYGGAFSHELDFMSASGNAAIAHDFNDKNTTLSAGVNLETDSIRPIGGAPVAWSEYGQFLKQGNKSKRVEDLLLGLTQIMNRRWITQLNYSIDASNGYQNDPYKILSVLDSQGNPLGYDYENRPEHRVRRSLYWDNKFALNRDTFQVSFRHMSDDWGITSQTADFHYRWMFADNSYLEPHLRRYTQSAANFYRLFLIQGDPAQTYASADPRLAAFDASTVGLKFGVPMGAGSEFSVRVERYLQKGRQAPSIPAQLQGLDLYPGLRAWIVQGGLSASF